jgi:hypothetical protein
MATQDRTTATVSVAELRAVVGIAVERYPDSRSRIEKAATIVLLRRITPDPTFLCCFEVESESEPGRFYSVDAGVGVCSCPDHQKRGAVCGHLWAVKLLEALARLQAPAAAAAPAA